MTSTTVPYIYLFLFSISTCLSLRKKSDLRDRRPSHRSCNQHTTYSLWCCRWKTDCCCISLRRRSAAWRCGGWRGSGPCPGWCTPTPTLDTPGPPVWRRPAGAAGRWRRSCSGEQEPSAAGIQRMGSEGCFWWGLETLQWSWMGGSTSGDYEHLHQDLEIFSSYVNTMNPIKSNNSLLIYVLLGLHLYQHYVVVVGAAVVLRVGQQQLGQDFLLCALVDGERVISCHDHHFFCPVEI